MKPYLYLSLLPESLVASMLPPEEFGSYLATGTAKQPHGQAMFFSLKRDFRSDYFDLSDIDRRCVPHPDGRPKNSVYLSIYRVLEHVPPEALEGLWLATAHGRCLELPRGEQVQPSPGKYHLYRELCPVHPLIASCLGPAEFCRFITDPARSIHVPRICFVELDLGGLADDPQHASSANLPYHDMRHIRQCLEELAAKKTKTVDRAAQQTVLYRCIKNGFFVGDQRQMLYYHYPTREELEAEHESWWRCANDKELLWVT